MWGWSRRTNGQVPRLKFPHIPHPEYGDLQNITSLSELTIQVNGVNQRLDYDPVSVRSVRDGPSELSARI